MPIAHPKRFVPDWTFGVRDDELQKLVTHLRGTEKVDAVVLLSHNGMDVDLKLASRVSGIDVILGGHTHDAVPQPVAVSNAGGKTLVSNAGSNGKFLGVLDLEPRQGRREGYSVSPAAGVQRSAEADPADGDLDRKLRAPHRQGCSTSRWRSPTGCCSAASNFNGTMDQLICDALRHELDTEIALSPGFRAGGRRVLPGAALTMQDVLGRTAITYPEVYVQPMTGEQIEAVMEDVCDNLFSLDPYLPAGRRHGADGGMSYSCAPRAADGPAHSDLRLAGGAPIEAAKSCKAWQVGPRSTNRRSKPVWRRWRVICGAARAARRIAASRTWS